MIAVSIVSHGHGEMVSRLVESLLGFSEVSQVIVTLNIPEALDFLDDVRLSVVQNSAPKGFGENHNFAFQQCMSKFYCVLNPDIYFIENPFPQLIKILAQPKVGLTAPLVYNLDGGIEDSARYFPSPWSLILRKFTQHKDSFAVQIGGDPSCVEWVAGMFMLFKSHVFREIHGFDERYYVYVEDIDICTRVWSDQYKVVVNPSVAVIHDARRASRINLRHMSWHIIGLLKYFLKYLGRKPKIVEY